MKNKIFITFILILFQSIGFGQCPDTIYVTQPGHSSIYANLPQEQLRILLNSQNPNGLASSISWAPSDPIDYRHFILWDNDEIGTHGTYTITSDDSNFECSGIFIAFYPDEFLTFDPCDVDPTGPNFSYGCPPAVGWSREAWTSCLGDTSVMTIANEDGIATRDYPPITYDRVIIDNAEIISLTDDTLTVVWNQVGGFCFRYKAINEFGYEYQSFRKHYVRNSTEIRLFDEDENTSIEICSGQSVTLSAESEYNIDPIWEVSDGRTFYGIQNKIKFDAPGEYTVRVRSISNDGCNCVKDGVYTVVVKSGESPAIECKQTVCLGEATTYYSETECDSYIWTVGAGGTIIEGGSSTDSYITVQWNSGPTNEISLSTPSCFADICEESVTETIAVINPSVTIEGPTEVCSGSFAIYSAPEFTGTNFNWQVSQNGNIREGQGTNRIKVLWSTFTENPNQVVSLTYNNCNIDCNGSASLNVEVLPRLSMYNNSQTVCQNTDYSAFTYPNDIKVDWEVIAEDGTVISLPTDSFAIVNLSEPGDYYVKAIAPDNTTCNNADSVLITIAPDIIPPSSIDGPAIVCIGAPARYVLPQLSNTQTVIWEVNDGTGSFINKGSSRELIQTWLSNGPYEIRATIRDGLTGCESESTIFAIDPGASLIGSSAVCLGKQVQYSVPDYDGVNGVSWQISPATAGSIVESADDWVKVIWNTVGSHMIEAFYCGATLNIETQVNPFPTMTIDYIDYVCYNESSVVSITTEIDNDIRVRNEDEVVVSTSDSPSLFAGKYVVEVTSAFGCTISEEIEIKEGPELLIEVETNHGLGVCLPFIPFEIFVLEVSSDYTYQWFKDNIPVGTNSPSLMVDDIAAYSVVVTDLEGCQATSNIITTFSCCSGGLIDPIDIPSVGIDVSETSCNTMQFEVIPPYQSTTFSWSFGDPRSGSNSALGLMVEHTFSRAGTYIVSTRGNALCETVSVDVCGEILETLICESGATEVEVPLVADFEFLSACNGEEVRFIDKTTKLPTVGSVEYNWDFGDPGSGMSNISTASTPTHTFSTAGVFTVTLTVTQPGVCSSTQSYNINIASAPSVSMNGKAEDCLGLFSIFSSQTTGNIVSRRWNFGDPGSGIDNKAEGVTASHVFSSYGTFTVSLVVTDINGCTSSDIHTIDIINNTIAGEISSDIESPKCPEDIITLTAPLGDYTYLWSNGETTSSISVTAPDKYRVTITDAAGCAYIPTPFPVFNYLVSDLGIYAFDESKQTYVFDSISVCIGQEYNLQATEIPNATYEWSPIIETDRFLDYETHFQSLPPGRYSYSVTITDTIGGCTAEAGPFIVNVLDQLVTPNIISEDGESCENNNITLKVNPYDPENKYEWSNGLTGEQIIVFSSGEYTVKVTNKIGCTATSNSFEVYPAPGTNEWLVGCMEVCFPRDFCINLNSSNTYELVHNGAIAGTLNNGASTFDVEDPGDYQLLVTNQYGCQSLSDILSLSATPEDQSLEGIVYLDENENGVFDGIDQIQGGVTVYLMNGNTVIDQTTTDVNGYYNFDPVPQSNLRVVIDESTIDFVYEGSADSTLIYYDCIEDKIVDFPLVSTCGVHLKVDTLYTCPDIQVSIDGVLYNANESDTVRVNLYEQCDSLYIRNVLAYPEPAIDLSLSPTCDNDFNGLVEIHNLSGENITFSLDQNFDETDTLFSSLSAGNYTLYVQNEPGCIFEYPFEIQQLPSPEIVVAAQETCFGMNDGSLDISIMNGEQLLFSLHQDSMYTDELAFDDLAEGDYTIFIKDSIGCIYTETVNIEGYAQPSINTDVTSGCENQNNGSLSINVEQGSPSFSLDSNTSFSTDTLWENLSSGMHTLYVLSQHGCIDSIEINVDVNLAPDLDLETNDGCENLQLGELIIQGETNGLQMSVDGVNYSSSTTFTDLLAGDYTLYVDAGEGCIFESPFNIAEYQEPSLLLTTLHTCRDSDEGQLSISSASGYDLEFSNDGFLFQKDSLFYGLSSGDHTLYVQVTGSDCSYQYPYSVDQIPAPVVEVQSSGSCTGLDEGSITISILEGEELTFDVNGDNVFTSETEYQNLIPGEYFIMVKDTFGCIYEEVIEVEAFQAVDYSIEAQATCTDQENGSIVISILNGNATFAIDTPMNFSSDTEYLNLSGGDYIVYIMSMDNCLDSTFINIPVVEEPDITIDNHPSCAELSLGKIEIQSNIGGLQYSIDGITFTTSDTINDLEPGEYILYYKNAEDCTYEIPFEIQLIEEPDIALDVTNTCEGYSIGLLDIINATDDLMFSIDGESFVSLSFFDSLPADDYNLWVTNEYDCTYEYPFEITTLPMPDVEISVDNSCQNTVNGVINLQTEIDDLQYSINGEPFVENSIIQDLEPGIYELRVRDSNNCKIDTLVEVGSYPVLEASMANYDLDCYEQEVELSPEIKSHYGDLTYRWSNGSDLPTITVRKSDQYSVTVSDFCDEQEFLVDLEISVLEDDLNLEVPNIFSPNGDNVNDCFQILNNNNLDVLRFEVLIFDRWGNLMFGTNDPSDCWNGKYKGTPAVPGVYVYMLDVDINHCDEVKQISEYGDVTVIR